MRGDQPVTLAVVAGAHGVAGEVRLKSFADDLTRYRSFNGGTLALRTLRAAGAGMIAHFAGIADRTAAEALRGTALTVPRSALPPLGDGEYYHVDLIGLAAVSERGVRLGAVVGVENFGAGDLVEIEAEDGRRFMVPMQAAAVPRWDDHGLIVADAFLPA